MSTKKPYEAFTTGQVTITTTATTPIYGITSASTATVSFMDAA